MGDEKGRNYELGGVEATTESLASEAHDIWPEVL